MDKPVQHSTRNSTRPSSSSQQVWVLYGALWHQSHPYSSRSEAWPKNCWLRSCTAPPEWCRETAHICGWDKVHKTSSTAVLSPTVFDPHELPTLWPWRYSYIRQWYHFVPHLIRHFQLLCRLIVFNKLPLCSEIPTCFLICRGYVAPEYVLQGQLTPKADVFSYGIVLLELVTGRRNMDPKLQKQQQYLLSWVCSSFTLFHLQVFTLIGAFSIFTAAVWNLGSLLWCSLGVGVAWRESSTGIDWSRSEAYMW